MSLLWAGSVATAPLDGVRLWSFTLCEVFLAAAAAGTASSLALGRRKIDVTACGPLLAGLALITAGGLLASGFATERGASLLGTTGFVSATLGPVLALVLWAPSRYQLRWFCGLWLGGALVSSLWALVGGETVSGRRLGLASHPNSLGLVCVLGTGLALGFAFAARGGSRTSRWAAGAAGLMLLGGLFWSGSRAALLGAVSAVPAVAVLASRRRVALLGAAATTAVGAAVLIGVLLTPTSSPAGRFTGDRSTAQSDDQRRQQLQRGLTHVTDQPVTGVGFSRAADVHSVYLQALVAAGPLGLIGVLVASGSVLGAARRSVAAGGEPVSGDRALVAGLAGGYVGYLVAAAFQNSLAVRSVWLYVAGTLLLARDLHRDPNPGGPAAASGPRCGTRSGDQQRGGPE